LAPLQRRRANAKARNHSFPDSSHLDVAVRIDRRTHQPAPDRGNRVPMEPTEAKVGWKWPVGRPLFGRGCAWRRGMATLSRRLRYKLVPESSLVYDHEALGRIALLIKLGGPIR
jgi:hypothetical protein